MTDGAGRQSNTIFPERYDFREGDLFIVAPIRNTTLNAIYDWKSLRKEVEELMDYAFRAGKEARTKEIREILGTGAIND